MLSEGRQQRVEPFSVSYSMRLHQNALWLYSYTIFCYHILYFHPLSSRFSNKIRVCFVGLNHCRSEFSQKYLLTQATYICFSTEANTEEDMKKPDAFSHASNRSLQEYSETVFRIMIWPLPSVFFPLITTNYTNIPEYRCYALRHGDYVWATESTLLTHWGRGF